MNLKHYETQRFIQCIKVLACTSVITDLDNTISSDLDASIFQHFKGRPDPIL